MFSRSVIVGLGFISILMMACQKGVSGNAVTTDPNAGAVNEGQIARAVGPMPENGKPNLRLWNRRLAISGHSQRRILSVACRERNWETGTLETVADFSGSTPVDRKYLPACHLNGLSLYLKGSTNETLELVRTDDLGEGNVGQRRARYIRASHESQDLFIRSEITDNHILIENRDLFDVTLKGQSEGCRLVKEIFIEHMGSHQYTLTEMAFCEVESNGKRIFSIEREIKFEDIVDSSFK